MIALRALSQSQPTGGSNPSSSHRATGGHFVFLLLFKQGGMQPQPKLFPDNTTLSVSYSVPTYNWRANPVVSYD